MEEHFELVSVSPLKAETKPCPAASFSIMVAILVEASP
jgi:hypothetical protein